MKKECIKRILSSISFVLILLSIGFSFVFVIWYIITQNPSAEVSNKTELMQALAVASAALIGLTSVFLVELARNEEVLTQRLHATIKNFRKARVLLSWAIILGMVILLLICFWFIYENRYCLEFAWGLFIIQLLFPFAALIETRIFLLR